MRDFEIIDIYPYGIAFSWDKDGEPTSSVLFERNGPIPSAKMLTFFRWVLPDATLCLVSSSKGAPCLHVYLVRSIWDSQHIHGSQLQIILAVVVSRCMHHP